MSATFPNRLIKAGEQDKALVTAIQEKLNALGYGPLNADGKFGPKTTSVISQFQSQSNDQLGNPLEADGIVGPNTWYSLFGSVGIANLTAFAGPSLLAQTALNIAISQIGVVESPLGSNGGPEVDLYLKSIGLGTGYHWCMAFVYWCYDEAAKQLGIANPLVKTGGVLAHWNGVVDSAKVQKYTTDEVLGNPSIISAGSIFIIDYGNGFGHTGIIASRNGNLLTTIEGNTNNAGSRTGIGVFRRQARTLRSINKGVIVYL